MPPPEKLKIKEETPLAYFQAIMDFIYDPNYARHLRKIGARYDRTIIPQGFNLMPFIIDALIFDTFINKRSPLEDFIQFYQPQMKPAQLKIYQNFKQSHLGSFYVKDRKMPELIILKDLANEKSHTVLDSQALKFMMPGSTVVCRLLPFQGKQVLTGSCAVLNMQDPEKALEIARQIKLPPLFLNT